MRVLLTSTPGSDQLGPLLPFAHALERAGHEVLIAAPASARPRLERSGLAYLSFADPPAADDLRARSALPGIELAMDAWRPHAVLRESREFAGAIAAEARAVPHARIGTGLALADESAIRTAAPALAALARGRASSWIPRVAASARRPTTRSRPRRSSRRTGRCRSASSASMTSSPARTRPPTRTPRRSCT
jgi:hypothetical protein